jgi:CRP-like cAMP-binding protein
MPALYLVRSGKLELRSSKMSQVENLLGIELTKGDVHVVEAEGFFGNDTLGDNEKGEFGMACYTVRAIEDVEVGVLDLDAIRSVVVRREQELSKSITMKDIEMIRILGAGTFGKVWLVTRRGTKDAYALKVQVKKQLIEYNQAEGVIREKNIMAQLDHPFIIKLVSSWKDENKLYMLLKMYQVCLLLALWTSSIAHSCNFHF